MTSFKPVTAALRVLEVLACVNRLEGDATVGTIHQQLGLDKATIVRMLETLIAAGYVVKEEHQPVYAVTGKTLMLSASYDRHTAIGQAIAPLLKAFREEIGWPSDVALFDHDAMLLIESSRAAGPLSFNRAPGYRAPVLGTSLGLAYLAHTNAAAREEFRVSVQTDPSPWNGMARDPQAFADALEAIRHQGYATMAPSYSDQEYHGRISSFGVPIFSNGQVRAAINVIYLKNSLAPTAAAAAILPPLHGVAQKMTQALDAQRPTDWN